MTRTILAAALVATTLLQTGCAVNRATATVDPSIHWESVKSVHVVKVPEDGRGIEVLLADKLRSRGFSVTVDPDAHPAADAIVTYNDKWMWDITMYMIELTVSFRAPKSNFPLATGNSYHTSLTRKSPKEMVDEVVDNILKDRK